jgi:hypothetical protein
MKRKLFIKTSIWNRNCLLKTICGIGMATTLLVSAEAFAREINYSTAGVQEHVIYVNPGEPTEITFPGRIEGGFKRTQSTVALEKKDSSLIVFANTSIPVEGEAIIVHLDDKRSYSMRVIHSDPMHPRDSHIQVIDDRDPETEYMGTSTQQQAEAPKSNQFPPASVAPGLMRNMILAMEKGRIAGIPGYRRSNRYKGEVVLDDGRISAKIEDMFLGSNYWGYVLGVENKLDTTQTLNPATFRLDGTVAVSAENWELAPQPLTAEQSYADAHKAKVYVITRSKRR